VSEKIGEMETEPVVPPERIVENHENRYQWPIKLASWHVEPIAVEIPPDQIGLIDRAIKPDKVNEIVATKGVKQNRTIGKDGRDKDSTQAHQGDFV
jgi:hypothetical protein